MGAATKRGGGSKVGGLQWGDSEIDSRFMSEAEGGVTPEVGGSREVGWDGEQEKTVGTGDMRKF